MKEAFPDKLGDCIMATTKQTKPLVTLSETITGTYKEMVGSECVVDAKKLCLGWVKYGTSPSEAEVRKAFDASDKETVMRVFARYRDVVKNQLSAETKKSLGGGRKKSGVSADDMFDLI